MILINPESLSGQISPEMESYFKFHFEMAPQAEKYSMALHSSQGEVKGMELP